MKPISAPRCLGVAAILRKVSAWHETRCRRPRPYSDTQSRRSPRQRKDHVEVLNGIRSAWRSSSHCARTRGLAFRAVPIAATVVGNALMAATIALLNMAAKSGGAATFDRAHDAALPTAEGLRVSLAVGRAGLVKNIRHSSPEACITHLRNERVAQEVLLDFQSGVSNRMDWW